MSVRRRDKRIWLVALGVFVAVFLFTFLSQKFKDNEDADAASLANFDPGYIISDYQMSNYNSMSEAEIQKFLMSKNPCSNTNYSYYQQLSANKNYTWHWANGHFVCLSEERFGDGETIGSGDTAAHIIWQAAQDYKINPQVLIVLLQKETGLITDPIPNNGDYRKATGYGCPDTAACSSKYYGFKNQVRNAAALFRTVLDGGWTNYPLGNNYIQYNPNAACGGSVVNIRSLATSALYRYTPYQPNAGALAAGYGTASCGAYGNRNFYLYFEDWFGGIIAQAGYIPLGSSRYMKLKKETERINPYTKEVVDILPAGMIRKYISKIRLSSGEWCLRTEYSTLNNIDACIRLSDLEETYIEFDNPRYLRTTKTVNRINPYNGNHYDFIENGRVLKYTTKIYKNSKWYYRTEYMSNKDLDVVVPSEFLEEVKYISFDNPRYMKLKRDEWLVNPYNGEYKEQLKTGDIIKFNNKIVINNKWYYRSESATRENNDIAISSDALEELPEYQNFISPRKMTIAAKTNRINPYTGEIYDYLEAGMKLDFSMKIYINNKWYYRTKYMSDNGMDVVVPASSIIEL